MLNPGRQLAKVKSLRFDSQFERDVFKVVSDRGFYARTQVCIGDPTNHRYRIDLVVEGMQGRLAVECDGDEWHGPERYEQDMARQRDLERAGWQFVRIRGGDFYRDPARATAPLWHELDRLGIKPGGIEEAAAEPPAPTERTKFEQAEGDEAIPAANAPPGVDSGLDSPDVDLEAVISEPGFFDEAVKAGPSAGRRGDAFFANTLPTAVRMGQTLVRLASARLPTAFV